MRRFKELSGDWPSLRRAVKATADSLRCAHWNPPAAEHTTVVPRCAAMIGLFVARTIQHEAKLVERIRLDGGDP